MAPVSLKEKKVIEIKNLTKKYGKKVALNGISLQIDKGMYGLLGKNGAGKTTLMKILTTLKKPSGGEVYIEGISIKQKKKIRKWIGYVPQEFSMYPNFTCYEMLDYLLLLEGVKDKWERDDRIYEALESVDLLEQVNFRVRELSGGMKRRLGIAQAIMSDPKVLIVDEPTVGLDPESRVHFRNLLRTLANDRIVLLSTHIVADIESTCDRIGILQSGNLIFDGDSNELLQLAKGHVWKVAFTKEQWEKEIADNGKILQSVQSIREQDGTIVIRMISQNQPWSHAEETEPMLEDAYLYVSDQNRTEEKSRREGKACRP